jgi:hypothetical protein
MRLAEGPRFGSGFGAADHRRSGGTSQYISLSGGIDLLGGATCPGKDESAEENHSSRSAKGNKYLGRVLNQAAHAAVKKKGSVIFRSRSGVCCLGWAISPPSGPSLSALPRGLEDLSRGRAIYRARPRTGSPGQEETRSDAGASPSQAWVRSHNHTHKPCYH